MTVFVQSCQFFQWQLSLFLFQKIYEPLKLKNFRCIVDNACKISKLENSPLPLLFTKSQTFPSSLFNTWTTWTKV